MSRTSSAAVQALLLRNYDGSSSLTPFIDTASSLIDQVVTMAAAKVSPITVTSVQAELLERWMAAHFYACQDALYTSRSTMGGSGSFQVGQPDEGFGATEYGRQAMAMDYSGSLKQLSKKKRAVAVWLGKPPSQQIDYEDRN